MRAALGLGSNQGDSRGYLRAALDSLDALCGTRVTAVSSLYRTAPVGYADQPDFYNAVAEVETSLSPRALLAPAWGSKQHSAGCVLSGMPPASSMSIFCSWRMCVPPTRSLPCRIPV